MEGHYFADKSKPCFKVFVKKELQIFRFLVDKIRLIFAGESNSFFGRNWEITEIFNRDKSFVANTGNGRIKIDSDGAFILSTIKNEYWTYLLLHGITDYFDHWNLWIFFISFYFLAYFLNFNFNRF